MIIETAIKRVYANYEKAKKRKDVQKPIAWALYKAYEWADEYEKPREKKCEE